MFTIRLCELYIAITSAVAILTSLLCCSCLSSELKHLGPRLKENFSVDLVLARPKPKNPLETLSFLWNDPRPVTSLVVGDSSGGNGAAPYCVVSKEFEAAGTFRFQVLLYPTGIFAKSTKSGDFPASAYLRYLPSRYGDEVDIAWKMRLVDGNTRKALPIGTSGGLPRSQDTWSSAMTFVSPMEAVESLGRVSDWGCSAWQSDDVCAALGKLKAEIEISFFRSRQGESSFTLPLGGKGSIGAVKKAVLNCSSPDVQRTFRAGEVIVPTFFNSDVELRRRLHRCGVFEGVDYRIMTLRSQGGQEIFSTNNLPNGEQLSAKLAIRPVGWKAHKRMWRKRGFKEWPIEIDAGVLSSISLTRFNFRSFLPRLIATFSQDSKALLVGCALAVAPIPVTFVSREFVSLYAIPSASMEPTLQRGDILLVEKTPGSTKRATRGDVVLFKPPPALQDIISINTNGKNRIDSQSLFVKRLVGLPGDKDIVVDSGTGEVTVHGIPAVGPNRNLCSDEPNKLIDKFLEKGKGNNIALLAMDEVYVLGDCKSLSVDSRVFGALPKKNVVGKPIARIWPPMRFNVGSSL